MIIKSVIANSYRKNKRLLVFTILSYTDKLIIFILPLLILYISNNKADYNKIEYIYSIANILVIIFNFISIYSFYGYKISEDKSEFVEKLKAYNLVTLSGLVLLSILFYPLIKSIPHIASTALYLFIAIRIFYLLFINYFSSYYRLIDIPVRILIFSISANALSILLIGVVHFLKLNIIIEAFFIPQLLILLCFGRKIVRSFENLNFKLYGSYVKKSISYSFPLIINCTIVAFIANYGKIYAYNFLSPYDMYCFSYIMRISMIIQMAHTSIVAFYSKDIFIQGFTKKIVKPYLVYILIAAVLSFLILLAFNSFIPVDRIRIDITVLFIFIYTILYCFSAFLEMYYNRINSNFKILYLSVFSCLVYLALIFGAGIKGLFSMSLYMLIYSLVYFSLLFYNFKYRNHNA